MDEYHGLGVYSHTISMQCHHNLFKVRKTHRMSIRIDTMVAYYCTTKNFIDPISNGRHSDKACAVPTLIFACGFKAVCWCVPFSCCRCHNSDKNMLIAVGCFECPLSPCILVLWFLNFGLYCLILRRHLLVPFVESTYELSHFKNQLRIFA